MGYNKHGMTQEAVANKLIKLGGPHDPEDVAKICGLSLAAARGHVGRIAKSDKYETKYTSAKKGGTRLRELEVIGLAPAVIEKPCMRQAFIDLICFKKPLAVT